MVVCPAASIEPPARSLLRSNSMLGRDAFSHSRQMDERARLGNPSYVWRFGQDRRLDLLRRHVPLEGRRVLDVGCGVGTYVRLFRDYSLEVYGIDIDFDRVRKGAESLPNLMLASSDMLP